MKKPLFLAIAFFAICSISNAQITPAENYMGSPEAAALAREVRSSVDLASGGLSLELPLYTLKNGDIEVPISLVYDGSGIRSEAHPTWVGLNWSLKAGGKITRVVKGAPDELILIAERGGSVKYENPYGFMSNAGTLNREGWDDAEWLWNRAVRGISDGIFSMDYEPDEFIFNFCGKSGSFYFNNNGKFVVKGEEGYTIMPNFTYIPYYSFNSMELALDPLRHRPTFTLADDHLPYFYTVRHMIGFRITDPDGYTYHFGKTDQIVNPFYNAKELFVDDFSEMEISAPLFNELHLPQINTWNLVKIESPLRNVVEFKYEPGLLHAELNQTFTHTYNSLIRFGFLGSNSISSNLAKASLLFYSGNVIRPSYLTKIEGKYQSATFSRSRARTMNYDFAELAENFYYFNEKTLGSYLRQDFNTQTIPNSPNYDPYDVGDGTGKGLFPTIYRATYLGRPYSKTDVSQFARLGREKLDYIEIDGLEEKIRFTYNTNYANSSKPHRLQLLAVQYSDNEPIYQFKYNGTCDFPYATGSGDHWGYINNRDETLYRYFDYKYPDTPGPPYTVNYSKFSGFLSYRVPASSPGYRGYLTGVRYPTGGSVEYEFECNQYEKNIKRAQLSGTISLVNERGYGAGLRVKSVLEKDKDGTLLKRKDYTYEGGISNGTPQYYFPGYVEKCLDPKIMQQVEGVGGTYFTSYSMIPVSRSHGSGSVIYSRITESVPGNGRTVYTFGNYDNPMDVNATGINTHYTTIFTPFTSRDLERGKLLGKVDYNESGTVVKTESYEYEFLEDDKYIRAVSMDSRMLFPNPEWITDYYFLINTAAYKIYVSPYNIKKTTETYPTTGGYSSTKEFKYNQKNYLKETIQSGTGQTISTKLFYPSDYDMTGPLGSLHARFPSTVVEKVITLNENETERWRTVYTNDHDIAWSFPRPLREEVAYNGEGYFTTINYDRYDIKGNLLQSSTPDGTPTTYIWGYGGFKPVAKIENVTLEEVQRIPGLEGINREPLAGAIGWDQMYNSIMGMENALPWIYTHTHYGLSSVSNPSGAMTIYNYDRKGRLLQIYEGRVGEPSKKIQTIEYNTSRILPQ